VGVRYKLGKQSVAWGIPESNPTIAATGHQVGPAPSRIAAPSVQVDQPHHSPAELTLKNRKSPVIMDHYVSGMGQLLSKCSWLLSDYSVKICSQLLSHYIFIKCSQLLPDYFSKVVGLLCNYFFFF
jgi:hypothetical protein